MDTLAELTAQIVEFSLNRNWAKFHNIKDLGLSLSIEVGEMLQLVQWRTNEEVTASLSMDDAKSRFSGECADVLLYLLLICYHANIDIGDACRQKLQEIDGRYPANTMSGIAPNKYR